LNVFDERFLIWLRRVPVWVWVALTVAIVLAALLLFKIGPLSSCTRAGAYSVSC
jgi:hypothetical protein